MLAHERLQAWKLCHELVLAVYAATSSFPKHELYGLTSQARRAAFSAAVNIVEGSSKRGAAEFRRFLDISIGSLGELGYIIRFAADLQLLPPGVAADLEEHQVRARVLTWRLCLAMSRASARH